MSNRQNLFLSTFAGIKPNRRGDIAQTNSYERKSVHFKGNREDERPKSFFVKSSRQEALQSDSTVHKSIQIKMNRLSESNRGQNISTLQQSEITLRENSNVQGRESPEIFLKKHLLNRRSPVKYFEKRSKLADLSPSTIDHKQIGTSTRSTPMFLHSTLPPIGDQESKEGMTNTGSSKANLNSHIIIVLSEQEKKRQMQYRRQPKLSSKVASKPQPQPRYNMLDPIKSTSQYLTSMKEHQRLQTFISSRNDAGVIEIKHSLKAAHTDLICTGQKLQDKDIIDKAKQKQTSDKEKMRTTLSFGSHKSKSMSSFMKRSQKGLFKDAVSDVLKESMIIKPLLKSPPMSTSILSPESRTEDFNQFVKYKMPSLNFTPEKNQEKKERQELSPISRGHQIDLNVPFTGTIPDHKTIQKTLPEREGFQSVFEQREKANYIFNRDLKFIRQQKNYKLKQIFKSKVRAKQFKSETFRDQIAQAAFTIEQTQSTRTQATLAETIPEEAATNFIKTRLTRRKPKAKSVEPETKEQKLNEILLTVSYESQSPKSQKNKELKEKRGRRFLSFPVNVKGGVQVDKMQEDRARLLEEIVQNTQHQHSAEILYQSAQLQKAIRCASLQDLQNEEKKMVQKVKNQLITRGNFSLLKTIKRRENKPANTNKVSLNPESVLMALTSKENQSGEKFVRWNTLREKIENYAPISKTNPVLEVAQLLQEKVNLNEQRTPLKKTKTMVTVGRPAEHDQFLASLETHDFYKEMSNKIAIDVLTKDIQNTNKKMFKKLSLLRLDTLLQKSPASIRSNFDSSKSLRKLQKEHHLNLGDLRDKDLKIQLNDKQSANSQELVRFELTSDPLSLTQSVFVLAKFHTKEIQNIGYKSKCLEVQVFLQKMHIPFWLCKIPKYEQFHKFVYYGNFLKARQFLRKQELNIFNKAVVLAFSNLLEEADICFELAIEGILRNAKSQQEVLKVINNPMIVKLRKQDYSGVLKLFDSYYEPESNTSTDLEVISLRDQLYKVYKFAKNQIKLKQNPDESPPTKLPQPQAMSKKEVIIEIDSASKVEKTTNLGNQFQHRMAESVDFAFASGSFINTMSDKTSSFIDNKVISPLPTGFINIQKTNLSSAFVTGNWNEQKSALQKSPFKNDQVESGSMISFAKNRLQFEQQTIFNQNKSPFILNLSQELTPDIAVKKKASDKFQSPLQTEFLSYHSKLKNYQHSSQKSVDTSGLYEQSTVNHGPEIFVENLSDASRLSKQSKKESTQRRIGVDDCGSPAIIDNRSLIDKKKNMKHQSSVSNSSDDSVSDPFLEAFDEESSSTLEAFPARIEIQILFDEDDLDYSKTKQKSNTLRLPDKEQFVNEEISELNHSKTEEVKNIIPFQRVQTNLSIQPLEARKSIAIDTPISIKISMLGSSSQKSSSSSSQNENNVQLHLNLNQDQQLLAVHPHKALDQSQSGQNKNDDSFSKMFKQLNEQGSRMTIQKQKTSTSRLLEFKEFTRLPGTDRPVTKLQNTPRVSIALQKNTSDFQTQQRKNLAQVNRFINFMGGNRAMYKYIKQYQKEYKQGFSKRKMRQSIISNISNNKGKKSSPQSAYELLNTTYADHKFAIRFLLENYKNNKSNFKMTYGVNQQPNNLLALPGKEFKIEESFQDEGQSYLTVHLQNGLSVEETQSKGHVPRRKESFLFRHRDDNKTVSGIAMQQIMVKMNSTTQSHQSQSRYSINVSNQDVGEEGEEEAEDDQDLKSFISQEGNRSFGSFAKEAGLYISQLKETKTDPGVNERLNEAFNIQNYYHVDGLKLNTDIIKRLQKHLQTGKDIKIWQTEEPKLHEILGVDYQTIAQARFLMRTLRKATEDKSFGSQPSSGCLGGEDSIGDYINDSHEVFVHKYQNAAVEGVDVLCKANDSDIFGEKLLEQMKLIHQEIGYKLDNYDTSNLFNTSNQNTQTKWRSNK